MVENTVEEYDKQSWGRGLWDHEPDRVEGEHAGFPTLARRGPMGSWCGYVAVPPGHYDHGIYYGEVDGDLDVHGGLTYSGLCHGAICHVPKPGEPDNVWWFGFDCGHYRDITPGMMKYHFGSDEYSTYKDLSYVQEEIKKLAEQLAERAKWVRVDVHALAQRLKEKWTRVAVE